jgi:hypothetical protein
MNIDTANMAGAAFDAACGQYLGRVREQFAKRYANHFSDETHESIRHKARLVRDMQERGMSWSDATDHPDVYLGYEDRDYVSYLLHAWEDHRRDPMPLDEYRRRRLVGYAWDEVKRVIAEGGAS